MSWRKRSIEHTKNSLESCIKAKMQWELQLGDAARASLSVVESPCSLTRWKGGIREEEQWGKCGMRGWTRWWRGICGQSCSLQWLKWRAENRVHHGRIATVDLAILIPPHGSFLESHTSTMTATADTCLVKRKWDFLGNPTRKYPLSTYLCVSRQTTRCFLYFPLDCFCSASN